MRFLIASSLLLMSVTSFARQYSSATLQVADYGYTHINYGKFSNIRKNTEIKITYTDDGQLCSVTNPKNTTITCHFDPDNSMLIVTGDYLMTLLETSLPWRFPRSLRADFEGLHKRLISQVSELKASTSYYTDPQVFTVDSDEEPSSLTASISITCNGPLEKAKEDKTLLDRIAEPFNKMLDVIDDLRD